MIHYDPANVKVNVRIDLLEYQDVTLAVLLNTYYVNGTTGNEFLNIQPLHLTNFSVNGTQAVNTTIGHVFVIRAHVTRTASSSAGETVNVIEDSVFACTKDVTGGGVYESYDPADYSVLLHSYEQYPFTDSDFNNILANITGMIQFNRNGQNQRKGWIEQIKFYHSLGKMDVILNSNKKINS
jgi:hypothetical protein